MSELKELAIQLTNRYFNRTDLQAPLLQIIANHVFPTEATSDKASALELTEALTHQIASFTDNDTKHQLSCFSNELQKEIQAEISNILQQNNQTPIEGEFENELLKIHPSYFEAIADYQFEELFNNLSTIQLEIQFLKEKRNPQLNSLIHQLESEKKALLENNPLIISNVAYFLATDTTLNDLPNSSELQEQIKRYIKNKSDQAFQELNQTLQHINFNPSKINADFKQLNDLQNNHGIYFINAINQLFEKHEHQIVNYLVYSNSVQGYQLLVEKDINWSKHTAAIALMNLKFPESQQRSPQAVVKEIFQAHKQLPESIKEFVSNNAYTSLVSVSNYLEPQRDLSFITNIIPAPSTMTDEEFFAQRPVSVNEKALILNLPIDKSQTIDQTTHTEDHQENAISKAIKFSSEILLDKPDISAIEKVPFAAVQIKAEESPRRNKEFIKSTNSLWNQHVQPFITKNLLPLLASICIFIGVLSLIVAFWDKSPFIRYLATPISILLAGLGLHKVGNWLYNLDDTSKTAGSILKALSIFLAPLSFIMISILSTDPDISTTIKFIATPLLAVGLLFGWRIIFKNSMTLIHPEMQKSHSTTLLILNGLLLLLPLYYYFSDNIFLSKSILILGFYAGFGLLIMSIKNTLKEFYAKDKIKSQLAPMYFIITTIGTYLTVWGITHIRLQELPESFTYAILVCFLGLLTYIIEFNIQRKNKLTTLSYTGTSFLILGNLLGFSNPTIRPIVLSITAGIWFFQAHQRKDERQYTVSIILLLGGVSSFAFYQHFPLFLFPYLIAAQAFALISITKKFKTFSNPISLVFYPFITIGVFISLYLMWSRPSMQLISAFGLILLSAIHIFKATKDEQAEHIHTGLLIAIAALPFIGLADTVNKIYQGNILIFGYSLLGISWLVICHLYKKTFLIKTRSTGLFLISIIAFSLLLINLIYGHDNSNSALKQYLVMAGPLLLSLLLFINGFKTRSQIPVYLGLFTLVFIFPEIKDHYGIKMYSGFGSAISMACMLALAYAIKQIKYLKELSDGDKILDKVQFPLHKTDHRIFTDPLLMAALLLIGRTVFKSYPENIYRGLIDFTNESFRVFEIKTLFALAIQSAGLLFYTLWYKKNIFTYLSLALSFITCFHFALFLDATHIAFYLSAFFILWEIISYLVRQKNIAENLISKPITIAQQIAVVTFTFSLYPSYTSGLFNLPYLSAIPLFLYLIFKSYKFNVSKPSLGQITLLFLLCWQTFILITTKGASCLVLVNPDGDFYFYTFIFISAWTLTAYIFEIKKQETPYRYFHQSLYLPLFLCLFTTAIYLKAIYLPGDVQLELITKLNSLVAVSIALILITRLLNISLLWLWITLTIYAGTIQFFYPTMTLKMIYHPISLTSLLIVINLFNFVTAKYKILLSPKFTAPSNIKNLPSTQVVLTAFGQLIKFSIIFYLIWIPPFQFTPFTTIALYIIAISSIQDAKYLNISKSFYFWFFFTFTNIYMVLALNAQYSDFRFFKHLHINHLIAIGLFISLISAIVFDKLKILHQATDRTSYYLIKYIAAASIPFLIFMQYCITRNVDIPWERTLVSATLTLGSAIYLRYLIPDQDKQKSYGLYTFSLSISIFCVGLLVLEKLLHVEITPTLAFTILALSPFWFAIKSELHFKNKEIHNSARDAAQVLLTMLMVFYLYQNIFDIFFLPNIKANMNHYFRNAFVIFIASTLLWRTHKMKGFSFTPYLSITVMLISLFFMFNNFPPINLTIHPTMACYTAIVLGLIIWLNIENKQPLYYLLKKSAQLSDEEWSTVKTIIRTIVMIGSHALFVLSLGENADNNTPAILLGLASLWIYLGISKKQTRYLHIAFFYMTTVGLISSSTIDFIPAHLTTLVLLIITGSILAAYQFFFKYHFKETLSKIIKVICTWTLILFTVTILATIVQSIDHKKILLLILTASYVLTLFSPYRNKSKANPFEKFLVMFLWNFPCLLLATAFQNGVGFNTAVLILSLVVLNLGVYLLNQEKKNSWISLHLNFDRLSSFILTNSLKATARYTRASLYFASILTLLVQLNYYANEYAFIQNAKETLSLFLLALAQILLISFWFLESKKQRKIGYMLFAEFMYFSFYMQVRMALPVLFKQDWNSAYDVYFLMIQSFIVVSLHSIIQKQDAHIKKPINFSILGFPLLTMALCLYFNISQELMMHSLLFYSGIFVWQSYNEKSRFILSYAFLGFNGYIMMQLLNYKIDSIQAFVIPICITVLIYSQMFRDRTSKTTANIIRVVSLLAVLGTSGWEIIAQNLTSPIHHIILIALCSAAIYFAAIFKAKVYAIIGSFIFALDIGTIIYLLVKEQDKNLIIISLGLLLTVGGSILLGGYIYYRKNETFIDEKFAKIKSIINRWD